MLAGDALASPGDTDGPPAQPAWEVEWRFLSERKVEAVALRYSRQDVASGSDPIVPDPICVL
jgi:hypothetical protein